MNKHKKGELPQADNHINQANSGIGFNKTVEKKKEKAGATLIGFLNQPKNQFSLDEPILIEKNANKDTKVDIEKNKPIAIKQNHQQVDKNNLGTKDMKENINSSISDKNSKNANVKQSQPSKKCEIPILELESCKKVALDEMMMLLNSNPQITAEMKEAIIYDFEDYLKTEEENKFGGYCGNLGGNCYDQEKRASILSNKLLKFNQSIIEKYESEQNDSRILDILQLQSNRKHNASFSIDSPNRNKNLSFSVDTKFKGLDLIQLIDPNKSLSNMINKNEKSVQCSLEDDDQFSLAEKQMMKAIRKLKSNEDFKSFFMNLMSIMNIEEHENLSQKIEQNKLINNQTLQMVILCQ